MFLYRKICTIYNYYKKKNIQKYNCNDASIEKLYFWYKENSSKLNKEALLFDK